MIHTDSPNNANTATPGTRRFLTLRATDWWRGRKFSWRAATESERKARLRIRRDAAPPLTFEACACEAMAPSTELKPTDRQNITNFLVGSLTIVIV